LFVDDILAARLEAIETHATRAVADPLAGSAAAPRAFVRAIGDGAAVFLRPGSPYNKIIGAGLAAPIDDAILEELEREYAARGEPVRVELATLAVPETGTRLTERGYRLLGFENVLARRLTGAPGPSSPVRVERVAPDEELAWRDLLVEGIRTPDATGVPPDELSHAVIDSVMTDSLVARGFTRYLAYVDGVAAGGGSMCLHNDVALLGGSAIVPALRRRGAQAALIHRRLADAHAAGAELAIITTAPGTQSQANVMRHGFALVYARAILVRG
jgi:hypothetical protein